MADEAVFLAAVVVALALLRGAVLRFLAVWSPSWRWPSTVALAALVAWVLVVLAFATVVSAAFTVSCVDFWRRIRPTRLSPRLTRSP